MRAFGLRESRTSPGRLRLGVLFGALYLVTLALALTWRWPGVQPLFWPGNGFLAGIVLFLGGRRMWACLGVCAIVAFPLFLTRAETWQVAATREVFNFAEGIAFGFLARSALGPRRLLRTSAGFMRLELFAALPAAGLNAGLRLIRDQLYPDPDLLVGFLAHFLGLAIVLPVTLLLLQPDETELRWRRIESALFLLTLGVVTYLIFNTTQFPVSFLLCPLLMFAGLRLGPRGAIIGVVIVGAVCLPGTISGSGAFSFRPHWTLAERALLYQAVLLILLFGASFSAFMVAEQGRLRRLLMVRAATARSARVRAIASSQAKTEFLATMSHEIRTPMNSILGFTELVLRDPSTPESSRERVKIIADAGKSLMTILNDILDFSKVEAGQIELCLEAVDVAAAAASAIEIQREAAEAKGLALRLEIEGVEGFFLADGQRLRQVLLNLLSNAVKFTDAGHVLLRLTRDADGAALRFEVSDTGIGIEEEALGRLFSRFTQADSSTTRRYGGSGLGLAICKGLVERMGGRVGAESRPGSGSTFWFELPATPVEGADEGAQSGAAPAAIGARVLLVDDHPMNRLLGETLLEALGCPVDLAASGEEAVLAARERVYDLILMDVHMPGMDGLAATRAIREALGPSGPPWIVAMSADVMPENLERCRQAGMVDHIAKPVQLENMQAVLERWMGERARLSAA